MAIVIGAGALVAAGAGAYGAHKQSNAAKKAAEEQGEGSEAAIELQREMFKQAQRNYEQQRRDLAPYREAGAYGLGRIQRGMRPGRLFAKPDDFQFGLDDFTADPGYKFRLSEGLKALERSAAAKGSLFSGATGKAFQRFGQDLASQEYGQAYGRARGEYDLQRQVNTDQFNRYLALTGLGQVGTAQTGQAGQQLTAAGQNYANQAGQNITGAANAAAAGQIGQANAWGGFINNASGLANQGLQAYMFQQYMQQPGGGGFQHF